MSYLGMADQQAIVCAMEGNAQVRGELLRAIGGTAAQTSNGWGVIW
jgi:hypothetical protein